MMNKQSKNTLTLSAISMSALLLLSACSGDNAAEEATTVNESADTTEVAQETTVTETEVAEPEPQATELPVTESEAEQEVAAEPEVLTTDAGVTLYDSNCKVCHDAGLLNAPKYGDAAAWSARLGKDKETLYMHSAKGFNKMPAQAVDGVTEAQVKAAVDYLLASVS